MFKDLELAPNYLQGLQKISLTPKPNKKSSIRDLGKLKLDSLIEESYKLAQDTKKGKKNFRFLTPSPPPIAEKIRNKSFLIDKEEKQLAYVSFLNGKTEDIELPSFKEYTKLSKKLHYETEKLFKQIEKCETELGSFEKKMNGLEYFCKFNPGVPWNNDKNLLLKLGGNSPNKFGILKAFNEKREPLGSRSSQRSNLFKQLNSISSEKKKSVGMSPISELKKIPEKKTRIKLEKISEKGEKIEENLEKKDYLEELIRSRIDLSQKMVKIFNKVELERPEMLMKKTGLILADNEKYKGKIHSLRQMTVIKKEIENKKLISLSKCRSQAKLYMSLLEYLKDYRGMPKQSMITFVEAVKYLLEGGWVLNSSKLSQILSYFSPQDHSDLSPLITMFQNYLTQKFP